MYIERSIRGARDPHGSFAHSHAALGILVIHHGSFAHSHAALDPTLISYCNIDNLSRQVKQFETIIKNHEDAVTKQIEYIWSSTQQSIDDARKVVRHRETVIAQVEAERAGRKSDFFSRSRQEY